MVDQTSSPVPPVPNQQDIVAPEDGSNKVSVPWMQWFQQLRIKINILNESIVNLAGLTGSGILVKNGAAWLLRTITGTSYTDITNGDGVGGDPVVDLSASSKASLALADSAVQSVVAGTNISVDNTDPQNPIVSSTVSPGGAVDTVNSGLGIDVDNTDPVNPVVNLDAGVYADVSNAVLSVTATSPATVDNTDPRNPIVGVSAATTSAAGSMSAADKTKLDTVLYGTYTPTVTGVTNTTAVTAFACQYLIVGNVVNVSGNIAVQPTSGATTQTRVGISLPISSTFTSADQLAGAGSMTQGTTGYQSMTVRPDTTNNRADVFFYATVTSNNRGYFIFQYQILP